MYTNLTNEQAAKLATHLGPEFTAAAKNDLLNFADAVVGLSRYDYSAKAAKVEALKLDNVRGEEKEVDKAAKPKAK